MPAHDDLSATKHKNFSAARSIFQEHLENHSALTFLIGAGCSKCAGLPLTSELADEVLSRTDLNCTSKEILTAVRGTFGESSEANLEDYLSEIVDVLAIADRREERGAGGNSVLVGECQYTAKQLRDATNQIKRAISGVILDRSVSIDIHRNFISLVQKPIRDDKATPSRQVDYLVLNYDTIVENALALQKIKYSDGISGGATGWWDPDTFEVNNLEARVYKLHGSIDWVEFQDDPLPRRIAPSIQLDNESPHPNLIWPASTKYREAQLDPFSQLSSLARKAMRPRNGNQRLLIVCGYSFGDSHINLELEKALRESAKNLTLVVFTNENEPEGRLQAWRNDPKIQGQLLIFANRGYFHGETEVTSEDNLLWWKFENVTRILQGE